MKKNEIMKKLNDLLLLGDDRLYQRSEDVQIEEKELIVNWVGDLDNVMNEIRSKYNFGRGIAAPQLGIMKRLIYVNIDRPWIIVNPTFSYKSEEMFEVWDDCMCFPQLFVKVLRHKEIEMQYLDENLTPQSIMLKDDLAELLQHEYDHLDGILCTMRTIDDKSFKWRNI